MSEVVFVYGTLKAGRGNHGLLSNAEFLGKCVTGPEFTMVSLGGFPGVIPDGETSVYGELYRVTNEEFARLDRLEGYPTFYTREKIDIPGRLERPWIYLLGNQYLGIHPKVESGVWEG